MNKTTELIRSDKSITEILRKLPNIKVHGSVSGYICEKCKRINELEPQKDCKDCSGTGFIFVKE